jgi:hypothetical protein
MPQHNHWSDKLPICPAEEEENAAAPPVKFLKSEPVQHKKAWAAQNEWVHAELDVLSFLRWFEGLYEDVYKLYNFDAKWQTRNMGLFLDNMRPHWLVMQWDFGSGPDNICSLRLPGAMAYQSL